MEDAEHKPSTSGMQDSTRTSEGAANQQAMEHRRTDHERQPSATGAEAVARDFATKQDSHATDADAMDVDTEPDALRNLGLDSLQKDFTSAFHLCKSCKNSPIAALASCVIAQFWEYILLTQCFSLPYSA